jgi:hypothetical protein
MYGNEPRALNRHTEPVFSQRCKGRSFVTCLVFGPNRVAFLRLEKGLADEAEHAGPSFVK